MPGTQISELETLYPAPAPGALSWLATQLELMSGEIDARLAKTYAVPFAAPYPMIVRSWLAALVTPRAFFKLGVDPQNLIFAETVRVASEVEAKLKEAADAKDGLFELPLRADTVESGRAYPTPLGYSEQSPYSWRHKQFDAVKTNRRYG